MCKMNVNLIHLFFSVKNTQGKRFCIMCKKLVAFFSASGTTKKVADMIAEEAKADLFEIEPKIPYTKADLDWMDKKSRSSVEMSDKKYRPEIIKKEMDMSSYDEILLGFNIQNGGMWLRQSSIHFWKLMILAVKRSCFLQHPVEVDSVIL